MSALPDSANSSQDYCINKGIPDGSNLYYACLFEKKENKDRLICLHALNNELSDVLAECSDPGLARIKYKWWLEELDRLEQRQARHPITKQIQQTISTDDTLIADLKTAVASYEQFLMLTQPASLEICLSYFQTNAGHIWKNCSAGDNAIPEEMLSAIMDMAAHYQFLTCLQQPNIYLNETCCIVPASYGELSDIINPARSDTQSQQAFSTLIEDVLHGLDSGYRDWKHKLKDNFRFALILNRLARATAKEILNENSQLLSKRVSLTPFRKLCIAWWSNLRLA